MLQVAIAVDRIKHRLGEFGGLVENGIRSLIVEIRIDAGSHGVLHPGCMVHREKQIVDRCLVGHAPPRGFLVSRPAQLTGVLIGPRTGRGPIVYT